MKEGLVKICIDYAEIGDGEDKSNTKRLLVGRDKWTRYTFCHLVEVKGLGDENTWQRWAWQGTTRGKWNTWLICGEAQNQPTMAISR